MNFYQSYLEHVTQLHATQISNLNQQPYIVHLLAVRDNAFKAGYNDLLTQMIALGHDSIEDTIETKESLTQYLNSINMFDEHIEIVRNGIVLLTDPEGLEGKAKMDHFKERVSIMPEKVLAVKISDSVHNVECLNHYVKVDFDDAKKHHDKYCLYLETYQSRPDLANKNRIVSLLGTLSKNLDDTEILFG
jgi:(p)ppGpp synthase/HD superfamily hydrolase